jgi:CHAT domain-containing protein
MKKTLPYIIIFLLFFTQIKGNDLFLVAPNDTTRAQADSIMKSIHKLAFKERDLGKYENAEKLYQEVVRLKETYAPEDTFLLSNVYGNYAILLALVWKFDESLRYFDKSLLISNLSRNEEILIGKLLNKGNLHKDMLDLTLALEHFDQAEKILLKNNRENTNKLTEIYFHKSSAYSLSHKPAEALNYLDKILSLKNISQNEKNSINLMKFNLFARTNDYQKADEIFKQILKEPLTESFRMELLLDFAGYQYVNHNKLDDAIKLYLFIDKNCNKTNFTDKRFFQLYTNLGNCYDLKGMHAKALDTYQKALIQIYPNFTNTDYRFDPPLASTYEEAQNTTLFKNKAEVMCKYSKVTNDTSYLSVSLRNCLRSINIIQKMRFRVTSDQSQFLISKNERYSFNLTQYVALEQYALTKDKKYLNLAFEVNEKGKSFTLLSALRNQKAIDYGNIPDRIKKKEVELNRQLSLYDELIYNEKQKDAPDHQKISNWEDQLFLTNQEYLKLMHNLERDYPEYYRLKFDEDVTDLYDIQKKIDKNTVLLEYSNLDSILIIYSVSRDKMEATKVILEPGFEEKCLEFLNLITTQNFSDSVRSTFLKYKALAFELYSILIEPVKSQITGENLIIIPDGAISYLPFDALLTSDISTERLNYRHIPYLIKKYSVGYSYSSTLHFNPVKHIKVPTEVILAFAPFYSDASSDSSQYSQTRNQEFLNLKVLPGAIFEVNEISKIHRTDGYYNVAAKESIFKEISGRYNILHLAMHTQIDNNDPMLSKLVFSQIPDGEEDGLLHTYEIYNLKLNASLVVLSSCSSGYGKFQPGEGVQSLARGFAYAGCPSIVMTLWEASDYSTAFILSDFYKYLLQHRTLPQALRESKLEYLSHSDQLLSNPFFWASQVAIGDSSPIYPLDPETAALNAIMLLLPLGFLSIYYRKYRKESRNKNMKKNKKPRYSDFL